ncbi:ABC transporter ATP-binding protein [Benzoatithermus flavus]|uniref:ATP-binding cassette domain-containing protein n=1 Tax=Benzoatithermus flavus TaxID=3108223 RepID=A0ABU8XPV0_9PROT
MAALSLEVRAKSFPAVGTAPEKRVLENVRLSVEPGERLAIIGPSGCGKTTLLNIAAGLDRDFEGRLVRDRSARLAYVFQEPRLLPWRTVADNLRFVLFDDDPTEVDARITAVLAEVGLEGTQAVFASRLSLGMARRAALARAFVVRPDLLLLDEPFVSLDEPTAQHLRLLLLELLERHRTTVLFVTHALHEAIMLADRLLFLTASPARVLAVREVPLGAAERRDPLAVEACRNRLLAEEAELARLLLPASAAAPSPLAEVAPG